MEKMEKPNYWEGNPEKQRLAQERAQAIREGRLPAWEAKQRAGQAHEPKPIQIKPNYREDNPEKRAEAQRRLRALYPNPKGENQPEEKAA